MEFDTQWGYWRVNSKRFGYGFWVWLWCLCVPAVIVLVSGPFASVVVLYAIFWWPLLLIGPVVGTILSVVSVIYGIREKDQDPLLGGILGLIPFVLFLYFFGWYLAGK